MPMASPAPTGAASPGSSIFCAPTASTRNRPALRVSTHTAPSAPKPISRIATGGRPGTDSTRPSTIRAAPEVVPTHTSLALRACTLTAVSLGSPSAKPQCWMPSAAIRVMPRSSVATHRASSGARDSRTTALPVIRVSAGSTGWMRRPSKRARPSNVPIHRKPSSVCSSAFTEFCGRPASAPQLSSTNWLSRLAGTGSGGGADGCASAAPLSITAHISSSVQHSAARPPERIEKRLNNLRDERTWRASAGGCTVLDPARPEDRAAVWGQNFSRSRRLAAALPLCVSAPADVRQPRTDAGLRWIFHLNQMVRSWHDACYCLR